MKRSRIIYLVVFLSLNFSPLLANGYPPIVEKIKMTSAPADNQQYSCLFSEEFEEHHGHIEKGGLDLFKDGQKTWSQSGSMGFSGPFFIWPDGTSLVGAECHRAESAQAVYFYSTEGQLSLRVGLTSSDGIDGYSGGGKWVAIITDTQSVDAADKDNKSILLLVEHETLKKKEILFDPEKMKLLAVTDDGNVLLFREHSYIWTDGVKSIELKFPQDWNYEFAFVVGRDKAAFWTHKDHKEMDVFDLSSKKSLFLIEMKDWWIAYNAVGISQFVSSPDGGILFGITQPTKEADGINDVKVFAFNNLGNLLWHTTESTSGPNFTPWRLVEVDDDAIWLDHFYQKDNDSNYGMFYQERVGFRPVFLDSKKSALDKP